MGTIIFTVLMQSLWVGLLLAAVTGVVLLVTKDKQPQVRYRLLTGCLLMFAIAMATLAGVAIMPFITSSTQCVGDSGGMIAPTGPLIPMGVFAISGDPIVTGLGKYASYIAWLWLAIAALKTMQMGAGLHRVNYMRHSEVYSTGKWWQRRVEELSEQLGIARKVQIMQSGLTKVPIVIGYLKPLILLPVGLINHMPVAEVEAIICHELAHIRRKDYLVNMFQSVMDVLFFFNPAVVWINSLIRKERENCCDDIALAADVTVADYINALVSCGEYQLGRYNSALAFAGNRKSLLQRVKRIAGVQSNKRGTMGKVLLVLLVCITVSVALLCSGVDGKCVHTTRIWIESPEMKEEIKTIDVPETAKAKTILVRPEETEPKNGGDAIPDENDIDPAPESDITGMPEPEGQPDAVAKEAFTEEDGENMKAELRTDGIISNTVNTSFEVNDKKLVVNDIVQPAEVQKKYFEKYVRYAGRTVKYIYTYKGN